MPDQNSNIKLTRVRVNNLKDVSLEIEKGQWLAICGLSGSGKSSLAFDTLYAEGQRRYAECLSTKTRQFIDQLDPPDADAIANIPPSIAIRPSKNTSSKDSVASAAELTQLLGLLFSKAATPVCPRCNTAAIRFTQDNIAHEIDRLASGTRVQICFPLAGGDSPPEDTATLLMQAVQSGFVRAIAETPDGHQTIELANLETVQLSQPLQESSIWIVADRIVAGQTDPLRITESLETALYYGRGNSIVLASTDAPPEPSSAAMIVIDGRSWQRHTYTLRLACQTCDHTFAEPRTQLFQPGHRASTCSTCAVPAGKKQTAPPTICSVCNGTKFNIDARSFQLNSKSIADWLCLNVQEAAQQLQSMSLSESQTTATMTVRQRLGQRLEYLCAVGLGYLRLDRSVDSLSAGERQRIRLTAILGSTLVNMLYVLDEPAIGLHQHEIGKLKNCLARLHERGNTLIVVDHNPELILAAHRVIEIGPGAGAEGGVVVFDGTPDEMTAPKASLTGEYIAQRSGVACRSDQRRPPKSMMRLTHAAGHNLKDISVDFPLGCLCVVTGVSGSGKSSLLLDTLVGAVSARKEENKSKQPPTEALPFAELTGDSPIHEIVVVDQIPIGRTGRSNPVTYVKAFDDIRKAFAETADARAHNLTAGHFSFNVGGGRCEKCNGEGIQKVDMQFLADVHIKCPHCNGTRYRKQVLAARYRDKNIAEVLQMTVREAFLFFRGQPRVQTRLKALIDVGLEYVQLGQPVTTLSSGEAQRLKLALYLNASSKKRALFIMDEPTTGLHMKDINRLIDCFDTLINAGHSLIVIEHNLQLIKNADYVIDLGPGAGADGGTVVAFGTPEQVAANEASLTGQYLKPLLV